jgi:flagellar biosynthetic protein FliR
MIDSNSIEFFSSKFLIGGLIFIRILGMVAAAPVFKSTAINPQIKIYLSALMAIIMTSAFAESQPVIEFQLLNIAVLALKEFFFGVLIGFSANMVFFAARFAGGLIDMEMGYNTSTLFDQTSMTPTLVGEIKDLIALMMFFILNGHHQLIESLFASFKAVPISTFAISSVTIQLLIKMAVTTFILAIKFSAPVLVALFCTNFALALLARVAPQTNIFILSFQMKISVGLLVLIASTPMLVYVIKWALENFQSNTMQIIMSLYPGRVT